jgi:protein pelota
VRLLHQDPATGLLRFRLETPSDLWRTALLLHPGERVGGSTTRRDPEAPEDVPGAQRTRRRVWLVVRAEQVEFHGFTRHVRVTGPIVEGPFDVGRHHTIDLGEGEEFTVQKETLPAADRALIEEGTSSKGEASVLVASVDWGDSSIVRMRGRVVEPVADVSRTIAGKRYRGGQGEKDRSAYVEELLGLLTREIPTAAAVVISGPGFLKEQVAKRLLELGSSAPKKLSIIATADSGRAGVDELMRSGKAAAVLVGSVAAEEADLVERLVTAVGGGKRAAVGPEEVEEASYTGAVETLLVSESVLLEPRVAEILERTRGTKVRVFIVRDEGEAGKRLAALGKVGALLRFDWGPTKPRGGRPPGR